MKTKEKLFNKDFSLLIIGQIITLFGTAILRFTLPLYLLEKTGSATLFGIVSACSFIPMILLTPFGGMIADRVNKKHVMIALDVITALVMLSFTLFVGAVDLIILIVITLMILYGIQGAYQPTVQASIPFLVAKENLLQGNAMINQVSTLANLMGPIIAGILYGVYGLQPILVGSIVCFIIAVITEMMMTIPHVKSENTSSIVSIVKEDIRTSLGYIVKEKPVLLKIICLIALFNFAITSMIIIGIPVLITNTLQMSSQAYGIAQGVIAFGGLVGGVLTGMFGKNLKIAKSYRILFYDIVALLPIGFTLLYDLPANVSYMVITICCFFIMMVSTLFNIQMITFIQGETPVHLIGKVMSICLTIGMCAQPIGQFLYGYLFEALENNVALIIFGSFLAGAVIVFATKHVFSERKVEELGSSKNIEEIKS